jgi:hypothetical protein
VALIACAQALTIALALRFWPPGAPPISTRRTLKALSLT